MSTARIPCILKVQPWFRDHAVGGKIVLPAVETMLLLAAECRKVQPEADIATMEDVRFGKFLEIPETAANVDILVEYAATDDGRIQTKLLSHKQLATMTRIKEHGEVFFPARGATIRQEIPAEVDPTPPSGTVKKISVDHIYLHMVPFGKCYQTLQGTLLLSESLAWGHLLAPELPCTYPGATLLGSPFPLDGALHAACVLGQQFVDFPPFPVGFAKRTILRPTQAGASYTTRVKLTSLADAELVFDLQVFDRHGQLYESVSEVRMRDVRRALTTTYKH